MKLTNNQSFDLFEQEFENQLASLRKKIEQAKQYQLENDMQLTELERIFHEYRDRQYDGRIEDE